MERFRTPLVKLLTATLLLGALVLSAQRDGGWVWPSRALLLILSVFVGLRLWRKSQVRPPDTRERLTLKARVQLSGQSGLALAEVDGQPYLIAFGAGFAEIRATRPLCQEGPRSLRPEVLSRRNVFKVGGL